MDRGPQELFGNRVRKVRVSLGLSQEELAEECGLHRTYVGSVERGERNISILNIVAIAREAGCEKVQGTYIQTKKNALVRNLYSRLNFDLISEEDQTTTWELNLNGELPPYEFYITKEKIDTEL